MAELKKDAKINVAGLKPIFSWKAPEFQSYKRDKKWILGVVLAAIAIIAVMFYIKQWTGVGLVSVATILLLILSNTKPKEIGCAVYNEGIVIDGKVYSFDQFKSFWLVGGETPKLRFQFTGRFSGLVSMPLGDSDVEQLRLFLSKKLPEDEHKNEDVTDVINRLLRL